MFSIARMLDANANRAREALRVMEDAARFALNDAALCGELKAMRHELRLAIDSLGPPGWLEANRDTPGDAGTAISADSEMQRASLLEVVIAAGKRLGESLRVIEEVGKLAPGESPGGECPARIKQLRYRAYTVESQLLLRFGSGRGVQWTVCVLLTKSLCKRPWREVLRAALDAGADCIQVREKEIHARELAEHVREVVRQARPRAAVIVNDRADIALAAGADGVHVGQHDLSVEDVRRIAGRSLLVGVSTHNLEEARAAVEAGADYCGVGGMFASSLKPDRAPSGPDYLRQFIERYPNTPHLAIGGITPGNMHELISAGAQGVAISAAVCAADDPGEVVRRMCRILDHARAPAGPATSVPGGVARPV